MISWETRVFIDIPTPKEEEEELIKYHSSSKMMWKQKKPASVRARRITKFLA